MKSKFMKKIPLWVFGGIVGATVSLLMWLWSLFGVIMFFNTSPSHNVIINFLIMAINFIMIFIGSLARPLLFFYRGWSFTVAIILSVCYYFILGSLIGFLFQKFNKWWVLSILVILFLVYLFFYPWVCAGSCPTPDCNAERCYGILELYRLGRSWWNLPM